MRVDDQAAWKAFYQSKIRPRTESNTPITALVHRETLEGLGLSFAFKAEVERVASDATTARNTINLQFANYTPLATYTTTINGITTRLTAVEQRAQTAVVPSDIIDFIEDLDAPQNDGERRVTGNPNGGVGSWVDDLYIIDMNLDDTEVSAQDINLTIIYEFQTRVSGSGFDAQFYFNAWQDATTLPVRPQWLIHIQAPTNTVGGDTIVITIGDVEIVRTTAAFSTPIANLVQTIVALINVEDNDFTAEAGTGLNFDRLWITGPVGSRLNGTTPQVTGWPGMVDSTQSVQGVDAAGEQWLVPDSTDGQIYETRGQLSATDGAQNSIHITAQEGNRPLHVRMSAITAGTFTTYVANILSVHAEHKGVLYDPVVRVIDARLAPISAKIAEVEGKVQHQLDVENVRIDTLIAGVKEQIQHLNDFVNNPVIRRIHDHWSIQNLHTENYVITTLNSGYGANGEGMFPNPATYQSDDPTMPLYALSAGGPNTGSSDFGLYYVGWAGTPTRSNILTTDATTAITTEGVARKGEDGNLEIYSHIPGRTQRIQTWFAAPPHFAGAEFTWWDGHPLGDSANNFAPEDTTLDFTQGVDTTQAGTFQFDVFYNGAWRGAQILTFETSAVNVGTAPSLQYHDGSFDTGVLFQGFFHNSGARVHATRNGQLGNLAINHGTWRVRGYQYSIQTFAARNEWQTMADYEVTDPMVMGIININSDSGNVEVKLRDRTVITPHPQQPNRTFTTRDAGSFIVQTRTTVPSEEVVANLEGHAGEPQFGLYTLDVTDQSFYQSDLPIRTASGSGAALVPIQAVRIAHQTSGRVLRVPSAMIPANFSGIWFVGIAISGLAGEFYAFVPDQDIPAVGGGTIQVDVDTHNPTATDDRTVAVTVQRTAEGLTFTAYNTRDPITESIVSVDYLASEASGGGAARTPDLVLKDWVWEGETAHPIGTPLNIFCDDNVNLDNYLHLEVVGDDAIGTDRTGGGDAEINPRVVPISLVKRLWENDIAFDRSLTISEDEDGIFTVRRISGGSANRKRSVTAVHNKEIFFVQLVGK
jgi:hypothetical protein